MLSKFLTEWSDDIYKRLLRCCVSKSAVLELRDLSKQYRIYDFRDYLSLKYQEDFEKLHLLTEDTLNVIETDMIHKICIEMMISKTSAICMIRNIIDRCFPHGRDELAIEEDMMH